MYTRSKSTYSVSQYFYFQSRFQLNHFRQLKHMHLLVMAVLPSQVLIENSLKEKSESSSNAFTPISLILKRKKRPRMLVAPGVLNNTVGNITARPRVHRTINRAASREFTSIGEALWRVN